MGTGVPWPLGPGGLFSLGSATVWPHVWVSRAWPATARGRLCPPLPGTCDSGRPLGTSPLCPCFRRSFSPELSKPASASFPSGLPLRSLDRVAPVSWPPQMLLPLCGTGLSSRRCPRAVLRHPSGTQCTVNGMWLLVPGEPQRRHTHTALCF